MNRFFVLALIVLTACGGEDSELSQARASASTVDSTMVMEVDTTQIRTYGDFEAAQTAAWQRYEGKKAQLWAEYEAATDSAYDVHDQTRSEALSKLRAADLEAYHQWLHLREVRDYDEESRLRNSNPHLAEFARVEDRSYGVYQSFKSAMYERFREADAAAYAAYTAEKDAAYRAYERAREAR